MPLPDTVKTFLENHSLPYRVVPFSLGDTLIQAAKTLDLPPRRIIRAVLLRDRGSIVMAILPCSHILDFSLLCQLLGRELEPLYGRESTGVLRDCLPGSYPPLPNAFSLFALVDDSLADHNAEEIYFDGGSGDTLIGMKGTDYQALLTSIRWEHFAISVDEFDSALDQQNLTPQNLSDLTHRYTPTLPEENSEAIIKLPELPNNVHDIMDLHANPDTTLDDIIPIIERDPGLAAQVFYWARSSLHGQHSAVNSLDVAIQQILGFDKTLHLILGSTLGQLFNLPLDGPAGLQAFWRHSVYCAAVVGELVKFLPDYTQVKPGLAYLSGLLHDIGYLVLGHSFPARYFLFNRFLAVNRHTPISAVERYVLGTEHWHIGAWLLQAWRMPEELIAAVRWHHHEDCTQPHAAYSNLVLIANRLLHHIGLSEDQNGHLPALAMFTLGISREQAMFALERVQSSMAELDALSGILRLPPQT
ncbi:MAG: HDOD domain-containing protein [Candidatus Competibacteraceae bacterium]